VACDKSVGEEAKLGSLGKPDLKVCEDDGKDEEQVFLKFAGLPNEKYIYRIL
jgi:hypothetical protein